MEGSSLTRRLFLNFALFGTLAGFVVAALYPIARFLWPVSESQQGGSQALSVPLSELAPGKAKFVRFRGGPLVIVRTENAAYALSAVCTHLGCIVKWEEENKRLFCPCHAAIFDVNGNVLGGPAPRPLPSFQAKIVGDRIMVGTA